MVDPVDPSVQGAARQVDGEIVGAGARVTLAGQLGIGEFLAVQQEGLIGIEVRPVGLVREVLQECVGLGPELRAVDNLGRHAITGAGWR